MDRIIGWPGVYWTARILLTILMGGASLLILVLLARYLHPRNVRMLLEAPYAAGVEPARVRPNRTAEDRDMDALGRPELEISEILARLEAAKPDYAELERLRRKTLLGILTAMGVTLPDADKLDSEALREILDREQARAA